MLNHFRTLLLNQSYAGNPAEHIPEGFNAATLPAPFLEIYNALFPKATSRAFKQFIAHNYINVVRAAGLEADLKLLDPRISYSTDYSDYFKIHRYSNPVTSNTAYKIRIYGQYGGNNTSGSYYDNFLIEQVGSTQKITIYSTVREVYIKGNQEFSLPEDAEILLDFSDDVSVPVLIGSTGINFTIDNGATFTENGNKSWEFLVEAPFIMNLTHILDNLQTAPIEAMFKTRPKIDVTNYENLWREHYNPVYRLAGLLLAYVTKLNG